MSDPTIQPKQYGSVGQSGGPDNIVCYTGAAGMLLHRNGKFTKSLLS